MGKIKIKIEAILDELQGDIEYALKNAVEKVCPNEDADRHELFRAFKRALMRRCNTWQAVRSDHVDVSKL